MAQGADCIITFGGIQSNHCRATVVAAKFLNIDCYLILRTSKVLVDQDPGLTGNLLVERLIGAHIELISKEEYVKIGSVVCLCSFFDAIYSSMHVQLSIFIEYLFLFQCHNLGCSC